MSIKAKHILLAVITLCVVAWYIKNQHQAPQTSAIYSASTETVEPLEEKTGFSKREVQNTTFKNLNNQTHRLQKQLCPERTTDARLLEEIETLHHADESCGLDFPDETLDAEPPHFVEKQVLSERRRERLERLELAMTAVPLDTVWHDTVSSRVNDSLEALSHDEILLADIDCRTQLCRIELIHQDESSQIELEDIITLLMDDQTEAFFDTVDDQDGSSTTVIFLTRSDFTLPDPES